MAKLHELVAVEPDLKAQAQRDVSRAKSTFQDGTANLVAVIKKYQPSDEEGEQLSDQIGHLVTTVGDELEIVRDTFGRWMDAAVQKEVTNQGAVADVKIGDDVYFEDLPVTALLNLEAKLANLRELYKTIPTNDPALLWEWNTNLECFVSPARESYKTKKVMKTHVAFPATKEHPAQTETYSEDVRVGIWSTTSRSGMLSPVEKRLFLSRIDELSRAVKQARQRANTAEVCIVSVASVLFDFIHRE